MSELSKETCSACRIGEPLVSDELAAELLQHTPGWHIITNDGINQLHKVFNFDNFVGALAFTNKVGEMAEQTGHHPALLTEWGKVTVSWWTHKIKGLHRNDFICAAKTNSLFENHQNL